MKYNDNQNQTNGSPSSDKINNKGGERLPVYDNDIQIITSKPASNYQTSPIGGESFVPHAD